MGLFKIVMGCFAQFKKKNWLLEKSRVGVLRIKWTGLKFKNPSVANMILKNGQEK